MESDGGGAYSPDFAAEVRENFAISPAMKSDVRHLMTQALTLEIMLLFVEAFLRMLCSFSAYMIPTSISDGWMYRGL